MLRIGVQLGVILMFCAVAIPGALSQDRRPAGAAKSSPASKPDVAVVTGLRVIGDGGAPVLEILSTLPLVPSIQFVDSPPRIVVDLLHARNGMPHKIIPVGQGNVVAIRAEQFTWEPPTTRVVLDLTAPSGFTWEESGNRLLVRLKAPEDPTVAGRDRRSKPPSEFSLSGPRGLAVVPSASAPSAVAVNRTAGGGGESGEVTLDSSRIAAGSSLTAGDTTTVLRLSRGGEVRVCPNTTVSVTPARNSRDMMLGISTGALETHYQLDSSADTILTPDFRILFAGPGEFDYAVSSDAHGNTCVRALMGNTSSAIVSELMGDRIYQVKPTEQVVFRAGQINRVDSKVPLECGCPPPAPVVPVEATKTSQPAANIALGRGEKTSANAGSGAATAQNSAPPPSSESETRPLPPSPTGDVHVEVEAPFVFRAKTKITPAPTEEASALPVMVRSAPPPQLEVPTVREQVQPAPAPTATAASASAPRRVLRKIRSFFAAMFH